MLNQTIEQFRSKLPIIEQRSLLWHQLRAPRIGASELASLLGLNPFCSLYDLMSKKINPQPQEISSCLKWGEILESSIKKYLRDGLNIPLYEFGLVIHNDSLCCSPDGVAIINPRQFALAMLKEGCPSYSQQECERLPDKYMIVLMEFKSLITREPVMGQVPQYYIPQVLGGIAMVNICEIGLYIESKYNIDLGDPNFCIPLDAKPPIMNYRFIEKQDGFLETIETSAKETMDGCRDIITKVPGDTQSAVNARKSLLDGWYDSHNTYLTWTE